MLSSRGFVLPSAVAFVFGIGRLCQVSGQANVYDTSTGAFRIACDPAPGNCDSGGLSDYTTMGMPADGTITGNPYNGGVFRLETASTYLVAGGCRHENCTVFCNVNCGCATGTTADNGIFVSDGGSCTVLSTTPGNVPTNTPTAVPTLSPTFDAAKAIRYDFTGLAEPSVMRISECLPYGGSLSSVCELVSGDYTYNIITPNFVGLSNCVEGETCILSCSEACACDIYNENEEGTKDCVIVAPTERPTQSPTHSPSKAPTSGSPVAVAKMLRSAIGVLVGGFLVLGML